MANPSEKSFALAAYSFLLSSSNPDSAMLLAEQGVQLAESIRNDSALANCYESVGWCFFRIEKKDSAEYFLQKAQTLFHQLKIRTDEAKCLLNLSTVYNEHGNYPKALQCLITARPLFEAEKNENGLAYVDRTIGVVYRQQGQYKQSAQYFLSAITAFKKLNSAAYLADVYTSYGTLFWDENNYDSALYFYRSAYSIFKNNTINISSQAYVAEDIAAAFYKKANEQNNHPWIDSAYYYYVVALDAFTKLNSRSDVKHEIMNIGDVLRVMRKYKIATVYLTDAFNYFDSTQDMNGALTDADALSNLYRDIGNYKKAYEYNTLGQKYKDTIDNRNRTDSIAKMFAQYETEKKDRAIQLLNTQKELDKQEISKQHIIEIFSLLGVLMLGILFIVLINRSRMRQQLKEVKVRNQLAADLHDEVGSSLSSILLLSKMASTKKNNETTNLNMLEKISGNTKEVIDKMSDIVWMMNPKYDKGENLREKLEQHVIHLRELTQSRIELSIAPEISDIKFPMEIRKSIFLIFKEALNNTLKYAEATVINISANIPDKYIRLIISDNGKGFDKFSVTSGNGLETMSLRAKGCKGSLDIQSSQGKGTTIIAAIPLP